MQATSINPARLGIHYFPDSEHYGRADQARWLPVLRQLGLRWIVLRAPEKLAIPQEFIEGLLNAGIQPIVHLPLSLHNPPAAEELRPILRVYKNWGVEQVVFFDRPNLRSSWPHIGWTQRGLVERFLEVFQPLAHTALDLGLAPVFPPLEPGGDYWDTAFLRAALEELAARGDQALLGAMALGAYAWTGGRDLDWGVGGPERWPTTLPYSTPDGSQDQRGFRIFDWYNAISAAATGHTLDILILGAGDAVEGSAHTDDKVKLIGQAMSAADEVPANVLACNYWLLSAEAQHPAAGQAWFDEQGAPKERGRAWLGDQRPKAARPANGRSKQSANYFRKDVNMINATMMAQLKELAASGVEVHLHVNAAGQGSELPANPGPLPEPDPEPTPEPIPDPDRYANYRKVLISAEQGYTTTMHPGSPGTGINRDVLVSKIFHNDVVEVMELYRDGQRAYVRLADRGDIAEQHANVEFSVLGAIGVMEIEEGIQLVPLAKGSAQTLQLRRYQTPEGV